MVKTFKRQKQIYLEYAQTRQKAFVQLYFEEIHEQNTNLIAQRAASTRSVNYSVFNKEFVTG